MVGALLRRGLGGGRVPTEVETAQLAAAWRPEVLKRLVALLDKDSELEPEPEPEKEENDGGKDDEKDDKEEKDEVFKWTLNVVTGTDTDTAQPPPHVRGGVAGLCDLYRSLHQCLATSPARQLQLTSALCANPDLPRLVWREMRGGDKRASMVAAAAKNDGSLATHPATVRRMPTPGLTSWLWSSGFVQLRRCCCATGDASSVPWHRGVPVPRDGRRRAARR